jgi:hypothetical protein
MDPADERTLQRIRNFLRPRQLWITRIQEIFFFRRPIFLNFFFPTIYGTCAFIYFQDLGFYSTIFLINLVFYVSCVLYCYADESFVDYLFPPNLRELDASAPNRTRSFDEVCLWILEAWKTVRTNYRNFLWTKWNRLSVAAGAMAAGIILTQIRTFWINFVLLNAFLFLPGLLTMPHRQYKQIIVERETALAEGAEAPTG